MNTPHLHLLLNHVPTVGTVIAFGLFLLSFVRKDDGLKRVSLEVFYIIALLTLPAYLSGVGTQMALDQIVGQLATDREERRRHRVLGQHLEHRLGDTRCRAVVEREADGAGGHPRHPGCSTNPPG